MKSAKFLLAIAGLALAATSHAQILSEGFDDVSTLAGWVMNNNSTPLGETGWFQGDNTSAMTAQSGADNSYIAANFLNTSVQGGVIDNWLISPELALGGVGATLSFFTRTADPGFADMLEVRFSTGSGSDLSSFTTLLLTVGDIATPYPDSDWVKFSVTLPSVVSGRFAFRYSVADSLQADYIGIDTVNVVAVPEPSSLALLGIGLAALAVRRRAAARA